MTYRFGEVFLHKREPAIGMIIRGDDPGTTYVFWLIGWRDCPSDYQTGAITWWVIDFPEEDWIRAGF